MKQLVTFGSLREVSLVGPTANAIKYSPESATVNIEGKAGGRHVEVCVQDQGKGISPEVRNKLFTLLTCSEQGTAGEIGYGLGLSLCEQFIKRQNGTIWVDDQYQNGTAY